MTASRQTVFDQSHYLKLIEARGKFLKRFLPQLKSSVDLKSALDAGCGVGFFSLLLRECGLDVHGFDGRESNTNEARQRYPEISFSQGDIEDLAITGLGSFDLVLCFGLLYHLENPLRAIRHLHALTGKVLLLESMCLPTYEMQVLLREEPDAVDQSLTDLAFYPSEGCIVKMLFRAGFKYVYRIANLPDHEEFRDTPAFRRRRTVILATHEPVLLSGLVPLDEPHETAYPWQEPAPSASLLRRLWGFLRKPLHEQSRSFYARWRRIFPSLPVPVRLPYGVWFVARDDFFGSRITYDEFETAERAFVQNFLKAGMTVLDVGAHHGLYALLASKHVGRTGKVTAFEPSPRERRALLLNLRLNRTKNVTVESVALGSRNTETQLYVVDRQETGCNSLRPPVTSCATSTTKVQVRRLDDWATEHEMDHIDFIKLDVEGGELEFLKGAERFLMGSKRPVILAEVQDIRTQPWGYSAKEIIEYLKERNFVWFRICADGHLEALDCSTQEYDGNFVAVPLESLHANETAHSLRSG